MSLNVKTVTTGRDFRPLILFLIASLDIVLYLYLNRADSYRLAELSQLVLLPGDWGAYALRFASSFLLFGLIPFGAAMVLSYRPSELGLDRGIDWQRSRVFWILAIILPLTSAFGTIGSELESFYPFSHSLKTDFPNHPWLLPLHGLLYLSLYYLPWEILFRGILIFPFLRGFGLALPDRPSWRDIFGSPALLMAAAWQIMPTTLIHYPSPFSETAGAIAFGLIAGTLALRYRSIWPVLIIHFLCGFTVDCVIVLRAGGLPG